jgi:trk system potassium uptake protein TrkH
MGGMIIAALPFAFHFGIFSKEIEATKEVKEILVFIILITICIVLFLFIESSYSKNEWLSSVFHVISASTTTGFQFVDLSQISTYGKILLIVLMLIGGTAFSTAGGIKIARLILIFQKLINYKQNLFNDINHNNNKNKDKNNNQPTFISSTAIQFRKRMKPLYKSDYKAKKLQKNNDKLSMNMVPLDKYKFRILSDKAFREALFVIVLFIFFTIITAISIYYLNTNSKNNNFIDVIFETASSVSNTGFSAGITTMDLNSISKMILSFNMIMGRFEIIAILYIFISKLRR